MFQELFTQKNFVQKKNKYSKRAFLESNFFNLVDIKSRVLFNQLTSNSVLVFSIYPSIVPTSGIAKLLLLLGKKNRNIEKNRTKN